MTREGIFEFNINIHFSGIITSDESLILFGNLRELIDINIAFLGKMEEKIQEAEYKTAIHDTVFGEIFAEMVWYLNDLN